MTTKSFQYAASIYHKTNVKLHHFCCSLDFTTTDCSILQIIELLRWGGLGVEGGGAFAVQSARTLHMGVTTSLVLRGQQKNWG